MNLNLTGLFLADLEREAKGTRRALEHVPDGRSDWKPHEKSMPLGCLASLVATMPGWISMMINMNELDLGRGAQGADGQPSTAANLLAAHEIALARGRDALSSATDEHLLTNWRLLVNGRVVTEAPRHIMIRDTLGHLAHHRGQLTVFLRLLDVPVPAIYGPSADDARFD